MTDQILVAGLGNIFHGDDGFGSAVVERLAQRSWPEGVTVKDFGIRGVHLAYELLDGYDLVVMVDAVHGDGPPGTLYIIEPERSDEASTESAGLMDAHDMSPEAVLALVPRLGGVLRDVVIVGCEPASVDTGMELSGPAGASVDGAAAMVVDLVNERKEPA